MTTAVDKWPASARLFGGRYGGPLTHRSYTTPWGTTFLGPCEWLGGLVVCCNESINVLLQLLDGGEGSAVQ